MSSYSFHPLQETTSSTRNKITTIPNSKHSPCSNINTAETYLEKVSNNRDANEGSGNTHTADYDDAYEFKDDVEYEKRYKDGFDDGYEDGFDDRIGDEYDYGFGDGVEYYSNNAENIDDRVDTDSGFDDGCNDDFAKVPDDGCDNQIEENMLIATIRNRPTRKFQAQGWVC